MSNDKKSSTHANRSGSPLYWSAETWAFMALRLFLGLRLLIAGLGKFNGENGYAFSHYYDTFAPRIVGAFAATNLPAFLVAPFAYAVGYLEIALGLLLLLGVRAKHTLAASALTFVALGFGQMILRSNETVTQIAVHLLLCAAALYFVRHNKYELLR